MCFFYCFGADFRIGVFFLDGCIALEQLIELIPAAGFPSRVFSLTGGGGKTSLMYRWAACLQASGRPVITAATTKLADTPRRDSRFVAVSSCKAAITAVEQMVSGQKSAFCLQAPLVTLVSVRPAPPGKLSGIEPEWIDSLSAQFPDVFFLVEADGAAGKSLKGYQSYEPVIPTSTSLLVPVIGLDVLNGPADAEQVHRPELFRRISGLGENAPISIEAICSALLHPEGYLCRIPPQATVLPFLNKAETQKQWESGRKLAACILSAKHRQIIAVWVGSLQRNIFARCI